MISQGDLWVFDLILMYIFIQYFCKCYEIFWEPIWIIDIFQYVCQLSGGFLAKNSVAEKIWRIGLF